MKSTRFSFLYYFYSVSSTIFCPLTSFYYENMIKYKHISIVLCSALLLVSCFGIGSESWSESVWLSEYKWEWFVIDVPASWSVIDSDSKSLPSPSSWEISLAASSATLNNNFSNNILILSEDTDVWVDSEEFSKVTHTSSQEDYYYYDNISEKTIAFADEMTSILYIFAAKYNQNTPKIQFLQTGRLCGDKSYLMTIAVSSTWDLAKYEEILKTFECK